MLIMQRTENGIGKIIYALGKMFGGKFPSKLNHIAGLLLWKLNKILDQ